VGLDGLDAVFLPTTVEVVRLGCGVLLHDSGGGGARRLPWTSMGLVPRQGALVLPRRLGRGRGGGGDLCDERRARDARGGKDPIGGADDGGKRHSARRAGAKAWSRLADLRGKGRVTLGRGGGLGVNCVRKGAAKDSQGGLTMEIEEMWSSGGGVGAACVT
jgi:hypothetical protein